MNRKLRIVFMGTPDFAVESLDIIVRSGYDVLAVVTAPDKPAGRGKKLKQSAVKEYAIDHKLKLMQPARLKDEYFVDELRSLEANLFVVVAFRMLPEVIWAMPEYGSFNLHASLLPDYRGAAPINWAIINGEKETGVTSFFLNEKIDTGDIIFKEKVEIGSKESFGELHDKLKISGASVVLNTIKAIEADDVDGIAQEKTGLELIHLKEAPKIYKEDARINWKNSVVSIYNHIRGLSPIPAAYTELLAPGGEAHTFKIFSASFESIHTNLKPGEIETDSNSVLKIAGKDGLISVVEIQLAGKKRMRIADFLRGFILNNDWKMQT